MQEHNACYLSVAKTIRDEYVRSRSFLVYQHM